MKNLIYLIILGLTLTSCMNGQFGSIDPGEYMNPLYSIIASEDGENNFVEYDFNNNGINDFVTLVSSTKEGAKDGEVYLIYYLRHPGNFFSPQSSGDLTKSFIHYNKTVKVALKKNVISLKHQSMRHDYELKFRCEEETNRIRLIGSELNNYGSGNILNENTSKNFLTNKCIKTTEVHETGKSKEDYELDGRKYYLEDISDETVYGIIE